MADSNLAEKFLFLSDVHLGGFSEKENKRLEQEVIHLVNYCEDNSYRLCILGDLFDYWMEYPHYVPKLGSELLKRFKQYHEEHNSLLFITGNHDNWTRGYFSQIGFNVESEYHMGTFGGIKTMLLHGDGLQDKTMNLARPWMHRLLRNKTFVSLFQGLFPPRMGLALMKNFSKFTRSLEEQTQEEDKLNRWAKNRLENSDTEVIICGHDHKPRIRKFGYGTFINLGTFYNDRTLGIYNNGRFSLVVWDDTEQEIQTESSRSDIIDERFSR